MEAAIPALCAATGKGAVEIAGVLLLWLIEGKNNKKTSRSLAVATHQLGEIGILQGVDCGLWKIDGDALVIKALEYFERTRKSLSERGLHGSQIRKNNKKQPAVAKPRLSRSSAVASTGDSFIDHRSVFIDHISSLSERSEVKPETEIREPDKPKSEHHELIEKLTQAFLEIRGAKYPFSHRDAKVVKDLRATAPPEQILDAWRKALAHAGFPAVGTLAQLQQNFAMFVGSGPPTQKTNAQRVTEVGVFKETRVLTGKDLPWRSKST